VVSPVQSPVVGRQQPNDRHPVVRSRLTAALFCELLHHDLVRQPSLTSTHPPSVPDANKRLSNCATIYIASPN
jgi:hypothetical protein